MAETDATVEATRRLNVKKQTLDDAYAAPANFLEIDIVNPVTTIGVGKKRYTDYEVRMRVSTVADALEFGYATAKKYDNDTYSVVCWLFQTNLPVFKVKESSVRRRYSDFEWLRNELERDSKIVVPPLPGKAWKRQLPFRGDDGIFEEEFIEDRRKGLEVFINK